jgi:hypothetical protein
LTLLFLGRYFMARLFGRRGCGVVVGGGVGSGWGIVVFGMVAFFVVVGIVFVVIIRVGGLGGTIASIGIGVGIGSELVVGIMFWCGWGGIVFIVGRLVDDFIGIVLGNHVCLVDRGHAFFESNGFDA